MDSSAPAPVYARALREGFLLLAGLVLLVPAGKAILYDTMDPDSFIHMLAAEQMSRDGVGPIVDAQSYMSIKTPWTPYSWLAEFAMRFIWDHGSYRAAVACHALMASAITLLCLMTCRLRVRAVEGPLADADDAYWRVRILVASGFAGFMTLAYLSFRPVTAALVIMASCVWLLVRDRLKAERTRAVWLVVPLTALLINVHLYAVIMPAWLFALFAGAAWEQWRGDAGDGAEFRRRTIRYGLMTLGCALACLATPMLPGVIRSILFYQFGDAMVAGPVVREYQPFYNGTSGKIAAALVVLMLLAALVRRKTVRMGEIFWLLGSFVLLLRMGRFSPVFAMVAAPIFVVTMPRLADRVLSRTPTRLAVAVILGLGLYRIGGAFPGPSTTLGAWLNRNGPNLPGYPSRAAEFVEAKITPRTGRLINEYNWGGYLSWRLRPTYQVLLDGRTNLFPGEFWRKIYFVDPMETTHFIGSLDADVAILPTGGSKFQPMLEVLGWQVAYLDAVATVMVSPGTVVNLPPPPAPEE